MADVATAFPAKAAATAAMAGFSKASTQEEFQRYAENKKKARLYSKFISRLERGIVYTH